MMRMSALLPDRIAHRIGTKDRTMIATASPHSLTLAELVAEESRTRDAANMLPRFLAIREELTARNYACGACSNRWHRVGDYWRPCATCKGRNVIPRDVLSHAGIINLGRQDTLAQLERAGWGRV